MFAVVAPDRALPWRVVTIRVAVARMTIHDVAEFARRVVLVVCAEFYEVHKEKC